MMKLEQSPFGTGLVWCLEAEQILVNYQLEMILQHQPDFLVATSVRYRQGQRELFLDITGLTPLDSLDHLDYLAQQSPGSHISQQAEAHDVARINTDRNGGFCPENGRRRLQAILRSVVAAEDYLLPLAQIDLRPSNIFWDDQSASVRLAFFPLKPWPADPEAGPAVLLKQIGLAYHIEPPVIRQWTAVWLERGAASLLAVLQSQTDLRPAGRPNEQRAGPQAEGLPARPQQDDSGWLDKGSSRRDNWTDERSHDDPEQPDELTDHNSMLARRSDSSPPIAKPWPWQFKAAMERTNRRPPAIGRRSDSRGPLHSGRHRPATTAGYGEPPMIAGSSRSDTQPVWRTILLLIGHLALVAGGLWLLLDRYGYLQPPLRQILQICVAILGLVLVILDIRLSRFSFSQLLPRIQEDPSADADFDRVSQVNPTELIASRTDNFRLAMLSSGLPGTPAEAEGLRAFILIDEFIIGRDEKTADLHLPAVSVGRQHARIQRREGAFFLSDLGSKNGTSLDGRRLNKFEEYLLPDRCRLSFADQSFYFQVD